MENDRNRDRRVLPALLVATASLKLALAWIFPGFLTGDDFEVVGTAARCAAGLDYRPWSIRSLFHPLVLACGPLKLAMLAGLRGPRALTFAACLPTIAFSTLGIWILYRLAGSLGWSPPAARVAALLFAFHRLALAYGSTPYERPISGCLLLAAFWLVARSETDFGPALLAAGLLAGAAFAVRWSEGMALLPLLAYAAWRRRNLRPATVVLAGFLASVALLVGVFDALTWGKPFASLVAFAQFLRDPNLGGFHSRPWYWYGSLSLQWAGPLLLLLCLAALPDRCAFLPLSIALAVAVPLSLSPLKELRYLQFCIPFLALAAALGWERLHRGPAASRFAAAGALILFVPLGLEESLHLLRHKSQSAVEAARILAGARPRIVVLEQAWAYGEKLYLGNAVSIRDLRPQQPLPAATVRSAAEGADAVCLYRRDVGAGAARSLAGLGFRDCGTVRVGESPAVAVYLAPGRPCPSRSDG